MATCRQCNGEKEVTYEEDGRDVTDACYHCGNTGIVDDETDFHDRLHSVAGELAYQEESDYRKYRDEEPDGDGYDLCAAENGLTAHDYFRTRVWGRTDDIAAKLAELPMADQEMLVAIYEGWSHKPWVKEAIEPIPVTLPSSTFASRMERLAQEEDDIPF